jgi:hypothetical protein
VQKYSDLGAIFKSLLHQNKIEKLTDVLQEIISEDPNITFWQWFYEIMQVTKKYLTFWDNGK